MRLEPAARLVLVAALVVALVYPLAHGLIDALLPLLTLTTEGLSDDYGAWLAWQPDAPRSLLFKAQFLNAGGEFRRYGIGLGDVVTTSIDLDHVIVPPALVFIVLGAWPLPSWRQRALLLAAGVPAALLSVLLTTPFLLAGKVEMLVQEYAERAGQPRSEPLLLSWMLFTEGGGRWVLPVVLALLCIAGLGGATSRGDARRRV